MKIPKIKKRKVIKSSILADKIECIKLYDKLEPYLSSKDGNSWLLVSEMKVLLYLYMYYKYYENY